MRMKTLVLAMLVLGAPAAALAQPAAPATSPASGNDDYPTAARADYVFACMSVNGGTQDALQRCSCSIDVIASVLPYDQYEKAETVIRMRRMGGGYLAQEFRVKQSNEMVRDLEAAQAEADVRCF
jgi:hypothetical protein